MKEGNGAIGTLLSNVEEKRQFKRVDLRYKVQYKVILDGQALKLIQEMGQASEGQAIKPSFSYNKGEAHTENISKGGLGIFGYIAEGKKCPVSESGFLDLEIKLEKPEKTLRGVGSIAWVTEDRFAKSFRAGVRFLGLPPDDLKALEAEMKRP